jgi:hypothetical protein
MRHQLPTVRRAAQEMSNEVVCLYTVSAILEIQVLDSQQRELCLELLFYFKVAQLTVAVSPVLPSNLWLS